MFWAIILRLATWLLNVNVIISDYAQFITNTLCNYFFFFPNFHFCMIGRGTFLWLIANVPTCFNWKIGLVSIYFTWRVIFCNYGSGQESWTRDLDHIFVKKSSIIESISNFRIIFQVRVQTPFLLLIRTRTILLYCRVEFEYNNIWVQLDLITS